MAAGGREEIRGAKMSASLRFLPAFSTSLCGQLRLREPRRQAVTGAGGGGARRARPAQRPAARPGAKPPSRSPHHLARPWTGKLGDPTAAGNAQGSRSGQQSVSRASSCPDGTRAWRCCAPASLKAKLFSVYPGRRPPST